MVVQLAQQELVPEVMAVLLLLHPQQLPILLQLVVAVVNIHKA